MRRHQLADGLEGGPAGVEELFARVAGPNQSGDQQRAEDAHHNLLRPIKADLPRLVWGGNPIGGDDQGSEAEQKVSVRSLPGPDLAELIAGKRHHHEQDRQKDQRRGGIIADQPDAHEGARYGARHPHEGFKGDRAHELRTHQHENRKYRPVVVRQAQQLRAEQSQHARQAHFDPVAYP